MPKLLRDKSNFKSCKLNIYFKISVKLDKIYVFSRIKLQDKSIIKCYKVDIYLKASLNFRKVSYLTPLYLRFNSN